MNLRAFAATCVLVLSAVHAQAQASGQARAAAETLFREAVTLVNSGDLSTACAKFEESQRLDPQTGTLVYVATCHAEQGKTATAWVEFNRAATLSARAGQTERAELARSRAAELEPKLSRVVVQVEATIEGLTITIDGNALETPSLETPLPVDPGEHEIAASAPGYQTWSKRIRVAVAAGPGEPLIIVVPALLSTRPPAAPEAASSPVVASDSHPEPPVANANAVRTAGWIVAGVGVLGVGVGSYFGLRAIRTKNDADRFCEDRYCEPPGLTKHDEAKRQATISTAAFGVGLSAMAVGVVLILSSGSSKQTSALVLGASPRRGGADVALGGAWR
jgi:PEGA domain